MSPSMALRRSPKPGALTAQTLQEAAQRLTTSAASASLSTSSAMMSSGRPVCATFSSSGSMSRTLDELLLVDEDERVFHLAASGPGW